MGQARNASKEERKTKKKGDGFKESKVCKFYLCGFCPEHEQLFHNTKRDIGECSKQHYEYSKEEFNAHPDRAKFEAQYQKELVIHLKDLIRRCDEWGEREKQRNIQAIEKAKADGGNEVFKKEIQKLQDLASQCVSDAEDLAAKGQMAKSKEQLEWSDHYKQKIEDWKEKESNSVPIVCEVCGLTKENSAGAEKGKIYSHEMGKVHQGYALIRQWYGDLNDKVAKNENLKHEERAAKAARLDEEEAADKDRKESEAADKDRKDSDKDRTLAR